MEKKNTPVLQALLSTGAHKEIDMQFKRISEKILVTVEYKSNSHGHIPSIRVQEHQVAGKLMVLWHKRRVKCPIMGWMIG